MLRINNEDLKSILNYPALIHCLEKAFQGEIITPLRHHHHYQPSETTQDSTLLLMPAWQTDKFLGIKIVTVSPENKNFQLPTIQGQYLLFETKHGTPLSIMDAKILTNLRTAAASALASTFLSRPNSSTLLMVGAGALAPELIKAHAKVRPINKVLIWARNFKTATQLAAQMKKESFDVSAVENLEDHIHLADIISTATMAKDPLILGEFLKEGQHLDLVGSYLKDHREADDVVIERSEVYMDSLEGATQESGDIVVPLKNGVLKKEDICGDLFNLCRKEINGRTNPKAITLFKSVGHALEDLAAATLAYEVVSKNKGDLLL